MKTRKILDLTYDNHITVTHILDPKEPNPFRIHLICWDCERHTHRRQQIAKYGDFKSCMYFLNNYYATK